jgi:hypothetical protein
VLLDRSFESRLDALNELYGFLDFHSS